MHLFSLPAELLLHVMQMLDSESFYLCLRTHRRFRQLALASKALLIRHLAQIPGLKIPADGVDASELLAAFSRRASQHLIIGVSKFADLDVWRSPKRVNRKLSRILIIGSEKEETMIAGKPAVAKSLMFAEVCGQTATISIYTLPSGPEGLREPRLDWVISPSGLPPSVLAGVGDANGYRILQVSQYFKNDEDCVTSDDVPVPYCPGLVVMYGAGSKSRKPENKRVIVVIALDPILGPMAIDHFDAGDETAGQPVGIGLVGRSREFTPIVVYDRHFHNISDEEPNLYDRKRYSNLRDEVSGEKVTNVDTSAFRLTGRVTGFHLSKYDAYLYPWTYPLPYYSISCNHEVSPFRWSQFLDPNEIARSRALGRAFVTHHMHNIVDEGLNSGAPTCIDTVLQLAICGPFPDFPAPYPHAGAYIVKGVKMHSPSDSPTSYHPYRERYVISEFPYELQHVLVAKLEDVPHFDRGLSTQGLKIAISPLGSRIAISSWDVLRIWAFDPQAFLDPFVGGEVETPMNFAYTEMCGWEYYLCRPLLRGRVVLDPVELPSAGVIYEMVFLGEDELWGWTDKGVCRWRFGALAQGRRGGGWLDVGEAADKETCRRRR